MKLHDINKVLEQAIKDYIKYASSGRQFISETDKFALFMNLVRANKYSNTVLRELYYKILEL